MHHLLYHANCADGFASACIAHHALILRGIPTDDIRLQPVNYQDKTQLPDTYHLGDHIYYLDYTPPQTAIDNLKNYGVKKHITIIDHHTTAAARHGRCPKTGVLTGEAPAPFTSVFSLHDSGAMLTWNHFYPENISSMAVWFISHRDLGGAFTDPDTVLSQWAFHLHATLMRLLPRTVEAWLPILLDPCSKEELETAFHNYTHGLLKPSQRVPLTLPAALHLGSQLRTKDAYIIATAAETPHWLLFPPHTDSPPRRIPAITGLGAEINSEALSALLSRWPDAPFAASWYICPQTSRFIYSLRSRPGVNVAEIATAIAGKDGGGHPQAAGFSTTTPIPLG